MAFRVNEHLEEGKQYASKQEMFPKLYEYGVRARDISIELVHGDWIIQTDSQDADWIQREFNKFITLEKKRNERKLAEAMEWLQEINKIIIN